MSRSRRRSPFAPVPASSSTASVVVMSPLGEASRKSVLTSSGISVASETSPRAWTAGGVVFPLLSASATT